MKPQNNPSLKKRTSGIYYCLLMLFFCNNNIYSQKVLADSAVILQTLMQKNQQMQATNRLTINDSEIKMAAASLPATYNWYVAATGNDNNSGTQAAPFRTIQYAINRATSGQAIKVADGRYVECINYNGKNLKIVGNPGDPSAVVVDGNRVTATVIMRNVASGALLCGFTITGGSGHNVDLSCGGGIFLYASYSPILSDLVITGNQAPGGCAMATISSSPTIQNTVIYDNTCLALSYALRFHQGSRAQMYNVTIGENPGSFCSIGATYSSYVTVRNSISYNPVTPYEFVLLNSANYLGCLSYIDAYYCNVRGGTSLFNENGQGTITAHVGLIDVIPGFVDAASGKYQLSENSPCIDQGDPAASWNDANFPPSRGTVRNDLGAYGWQVSAQPYQTFSLRRIKYAYDPSGNRKERNEIRIGNSLRRASVGGAENVTAFDGLQEKRNEIQPFEEMLSDYKITIYPNPTKGELRVDISGGEVPPGATIYMFNSTGTTINQWNNVSGSTQVDISAQPAGIYIMKIQLNNEKLSTWKIIKEN